MNNLKKSIGVLYSAGLDSSLLIEKLLREGWEVWPVYIHCGLPWEKAEIYWSKKYLNAIKNRRLKPLSFAQLLLENAYENNWSKTGRTPGPRSRDAAVYLPARNLLLLIKAILVLSTKNVHRLALATLEGNPFSDASAHYFSLLQKILTASFGKKIIVTTPFRNSSKIKLIEKYPQSPLHYSFSCINPIGKLHCGRCNKCAERKRAFRRAGRMDRTVYVR